MFNESSQCQIMEIKDCERTVCLYTGRLTQEPFGVKVDEG